MPEYLQLTWERKRELDYAVTDSLKMLANPLWNHRRRESWSKYIKNLIVPKEDVDTIASRISYTIGNVPTKWNDSSSNIDERPDLGKRQFPNKKSRVDRTSGFTSKWANAE